MLIVTDFVPRHYCRFSDKLKSDSGARRWASIQLSAYLCETRALLFWQLPSVMRPIVEIGKILSDGFYQSVDGCVGWSLPKFAGDFSMALYSCCEGIPVPSLDRSTLILAYDFALDSSYVIRSIVGACESPQLLRKEDQLHCICSEPLKFSSICVVKDSIPQSLFSVEYPVSFDGYDLYEDSIVIRTTNCCDKDYGIRTHVIVR
jgi:hypothetical protein